MQATPSAPIGKPPWEPAEIVAALDDFRAVYERRPVKDNEGGMRAPHLFATWFMARKLAPAAIIESGIWKGQGTWFLEQACPGAVLYSIDPNLSKRVYVSAAAQYFDTDFSEIDWSPLDPARTLVFFDDHQSAYNRLVQCRWFGFRHAIFEDNYPPGKGDFYTLKQAFAGAGFGARSSGDKGRRYRSLPARASRKLAALAARAGARQVSAIPQYLRDVVPPNRFDAIFLRRNLEVYHEFPPAFAPAGAAGPEGAPPSLLDPSDRGRFPQLYEERASYNAICYVRLNAAGSGEPQP